MFPWGQIHYQNKITVPKRNCLGINFTVLEQKIMAHVYLIECSGSSLLSPQNRWVLRVRMGCGWVVLHVTCVLHVSGVVSTVVLSTRPPGKDPSRLTSLDSGACAHLCFVPLWPSTPSVSAEWITAQSWKVEERLETLDFLRKMEPLEPFGLSGSIAHTQPHGSLPLGQPQLLFSLCRPLEI